MSFLNITHQTNLVKILCAGWTLIATSTAIAAPYPVELLSLHNKMRAAHHAPNLIWDDKLANYATQYAKQCKFQHSHGPYGENLAAGYPSLSASVNTWYKEEAQYSYLWPGFSSHTGHFTQLVWKASTKLGCGYVACNGKNGTPGKYLVCEYSPAGNVLSYARFKNNVLPI